MKVHILTKVMLVLFDKLSTRSYQNSYTNITNSSTMLHTIWAPCWNYEEKHELQSYFSVIKKPAIYFKKSWLLLISSVLVMV